MEEETANISPQTTTETLVVTSNFPDMLKGLYTQITNKLQEVNPVKLNTLSKNLESKAFLVLLSDILVMPQKTQNPTPFIKFLKGGLFYTALNKALKSDFLGGLTTIKAGEHMTISIQEFGERLSLPNGETIEEKNVVGRIDFVRDIPKMKRGASLVEFTKSLFKSANISLEELTRLCRDNDPRLKDVQYFYGVSHLAGPLARRLGFITLPIEDERDRKKCMSAAHSIAKKVAGKNENWQKFAGNFKQPQIAVISRQELLEAYPPKPQEKAETPYTSMQ